MNEARQQTFMLLYWQSSRRTVASIKVSLVMPTCVGTVFAQTNDHLIYPHVVKTLGDISYVTAIGCYQTMLYTDVNITARI